MACCLTADWWPVCVDNRACAHLLLTVRPHCCAVSHAISLSKACTGLEVLKHTCVVCCMLCLSAFAGIPVSKLVASEREKLLHLSDVLHNRVVGQDDAVEAVADAIQRSR